MENSQINLTQMAEKAKSILDANFNGLFTKPAPSLYPHQWNWDSGFIALGLAAHNWDRAVAEMRQLFKGQWENGLLPHIVFGDDPAARYFPGPEFWQTAHLSQSPKELITSGITQPPVHGMVIWRLFQQAPNREAGLELLKEFFPKLLALHQYLYENRDPNEEGLVCIRHPWEPGTDNSPYWDDALANMVIDKDKLPAYTRKDLQNPEAVKHRPTDYDYDRYVYLVDLFRRHQYQDNLINAECPFMIQDPMFNAILCWSNECLIQMSQEIGADPGPLYDWHEWTIYACNEKLWDEELGIYVAYDLVADQAIRKVTSSGLVPLASSIPDQEQAEQLLQTMASDKFGYKQGMFLCPTYSPMATDVDFSRYWRGPVWISINWLLYHGLKRFDMDAAAQKLKEDGLSLIAERGFFEYFDPRPSAGAQGAYGTNQFSWTAALLLDWMVDIPSYVEEDF